MPLLRLDHLVIGHRHNRRSAPLTSPISASLEAGQIVALVGANGCGKTTLLRTLAGSLPPLAGRALLNGTDISTLSPRQMARQVAVVLTERPDTGFLTAREVAATGRMPHTSFLRRDTNPDAVEAALRQTNTLHLANRPLNHLSDGERQRIMVAKALAQETPLILLDEPTAFLDYQNKAATLKLLADLAHREGKAILLSTHDLELVFRVADSLWLLSNDLTVGPPEALAPTLLAPASPLSPTRSQQHPRNV